MVSIGDFRVGVCHGHQVVPWGDKEALAILQRKLDCDILVTGHTHVRKGWRYAVEGLFMCVRMLRVPMHGQTIY